MRNLSIVSNLIEALKTELESQILAIPTGEKRNLLCDANIHLGEALRLLLQASRTLR